MANRTRRTVHEQLRDALGAELDLPSLAQTVYSVVARRVAYDFACFATTDPATGLITGASKTRSLGIGDEEFAAAEYGGPDLNSFAEIARRRLPAGALWLDTGGHPEHCRRHRDFMAPRFGFTDELRVVFSARGASWAALALYRGPGDPPFTGPDVQELGAVSELVAEAVQRSLFRSGPGPRTVQSADPTAGPAVLVIDSSDRVTHLTPAARAAVDELGGWDHGSLPANLLAVIASTRSRGEHTDTRARAATGRWLSLRAAPLAGPESSGEVVVTVEPTPRTALSRLSLAAHGLTTREEDVALLVLQGASTATIAADLHLSPHTVQDHLKAVFAKLGVTSRREMTARLVLD
ncbi:DNA-binding CsgD family transcriptional regulator [Motilibacter peucedani]|uniref:DNA-binding CsgD family transcriptional regulator n=1 Tax=Motilibacter peucedani TaxID=598650 RepID=A0A420XQH9_9ACTN|nr:helix-turn-helix transcriptional regulator [Motilibacter peucedani]RKS75561.1 DNA-binding CsgD family transcriptional regulator [Motilibacter peucedani]